MPKDTWTMHLAAVIIVTLACIASILWLALESKPVPEVFTYIATGGGTYLLGVWASDKHGNTGSINDPNEPPK